MTELIFRDRRQAGRVLAGVLRPIKFRNPLVLAVPTGGVPVAYEVAQALNAPLDVLPVSRIRGRHPGSPAFGAVAADGTRVLSTELVPDLGGLEGEELENEIATMEAEVRRSDSLYRGDRAIPVITGRDVILIDDGVATGMAMVAAAKCVRRRNPASLIIAAPTASASAERTLIEYADDVICLEAPEAFFGVGCCYMNFEPLSESDVCSLLGRA
jgi:putative phosphoribosyl transferase